MNSARNPLALAIAGLALTAAVIAVVLVIGSNRAEPDAIAPSHTAVVVPSSRTTPSAVADVVPWVDAPFVPPTPSPTADPAGMPLCDRSSTVLLAEGWGGATGSQAGGMRLVNVSPNECRLEQPTSVALVDAAGATIATSRGTRTASGQLGVPAGAAAGGILIWDNWCRQASPIRPLSVRLTLPLAVESVATSSTLVARVDDPGIGSSLPRCDAPGVPSSVGNLPLEVDAPELSDPPRDPCTPEDLLAFGGPWGAAMGSSYSPLVLVSVDSVDCTLPSPTTVELRDANRARLFAADASVAALPDGALAAGGTALASLQFANWCVSPPATPLHLDVILAAGRLPVVPSRGADGRIPVPPCMAAPATPPPDFTFAEPLAGPDLVQPPPPDPGDALPVRVDTSVPASVAAGTDLRYTVTLTNISEKGAPIPLTTACPSFTQQLYLPDTREVTTRDLLNCGAAGTIGPGESRTFEMRIPIPRDTTQGSATLLWQLGHMGPNSPKLQIEITAR